MQDPQVLKERGDVLYKASSYEEAIVQYSAALECVPSPTDKLCVAIFGNRSMCYLRLEDYEATLRSETLRLLENVKIAGKCEANVAGTVKGQQQSTLHMSKGFCVPVKPLGSWGGLRRPLNRT